MDHADIKTMIVEKMVRHMPCLIRFTMKQQNETSPGVQDHTGILFGCQVSGGKFEFGIYFKDPLQVDGKISTSNPHGVRILEPSQQSYKIFAGAAFSMTCYYHWDKEGRLSDTTPYTRDFYAATEVQLNPNKSDSWARMNSIFPKKIRKLEEMEQVHQFLSGSMDDKLPVSNPLLIPHLNAKCQPRYFSAHTGRRMLMGRGRSRGHKRMKESTDPSTKPKKRPKSSSRNGGIVLPSQEQQQPSSSLPLSLPLSMSTQPIPTQLTQSTQPLSTQLTQLTQPTQPMSLPLPLLPYSSSDLLPSLPYPLSPLPLQSFPYPLSPQPLQSLPYPSSPLLYPQCPSSPFSLTLQPSPFELLPPLQPPTSSVDDIFTVECPGCHRDIIERWIENPSFFCCRIQVCKTCAEMRSKEWNETIPQTSCMGSWLNKTPCAKYY